MKYGSITPQSLDKAFYVYKFSFLDWLSIMQLDGRIDKIGSKTYRIVNLDPFRDLTHPLEVSITPNLCFVPPGIRSNQEERTF